MIKQIDIVVPKIDRGAVIITDLIKRKLGTLPSCGIMHLFIKHTSAAITINENADPSVITDMNYILDKLIPERDPNYIHTYEGDDDMPAHAKATLVGSSITVPITNGRLNLGVWQGIYLYEFRDDGGGRNLVATIYS